MLNDYLATFFRRFIVVMLEYLFSFQGRSGRLSYFLFGFVWALLFVVGGGVLYFLGMLTPVLLVPAAFVLVPAVFISSLAISVRRLHDMNLTGWVLAFVMMLLVVANFSEYWLPYVSGAYGSSYTAYGVLFALGFVQVFYWMLLLWPGSAEMNRFD